MESTDSDDHQILSRFSPPRKVAKADPSVLKPELVEVVTSALAGHAEETLGLVDFCELLDASVESLLSEGGPTAHLFAPGEKRGF